MTRTKIMAAELPVGKVFSEDYRFEVPPYQRPYAWTNEQAGELLDDLLAAALEKPSIGEVDPYFLGSIVLVKPEGDTRADIVDGQQRLTTLTILLAALRDLCPELAQNLQLRIFQLADPLAGVEAQPRLRIRPADQGFFEKHIQRAERSAELDTLLAETLSRESQRNIVENYRLFIGRLAALDAEARQTLAQYIVRCTYLVVVATQNFESAYRIFTVLNERGLDLSHSDILKAEIIGEIKDDDRAAYTTKWEAEEEDLGRAEFADLFAHIRMVFARTKARGSILQEFRSAVLEKYPDRRKFVDDVLVPYSDAYEVVLREDYRGSGDADGVNQLLGWLNRLDNRDWVAPALRYLTRQDVSADQVQRFLADLERLAASMFVRRVDITRRIERYGRVLDWIRRGDDLSAGQSPLQLDEAERAQTVAALQDEIYTVTRTRLYVLLRLDSVLAGAGATYDHPTITVEHVLPQSPRPGTDWAQRFSDAERRYWTHRLANLVLLTRRKNSQAGTLPFEEKKRRYFASRDGVTNFALTTQVLATPEWTPEVLAARQEELVGKLVELWRL